MDVSRRKASYLMVVSIKLFGYNLFASKHTCLISKMRVYSQNGLLFKYDFADLEKILRICMTICVYH